MFPTGSLQHHLMGENKNLLLANLLPHGQEVDFSHINQPIEYSLYYKILALRATEIISKLSISRIHQVKEGKSPPAKGKGNNRN
jgi:hypothetical protein